MCFISLLQMVFYCGVLLCLTALVTQVTTAYHYLHTWTSKSDPSRTNMTTLFQCQCSKEATTATGMVPHCTLEANKQVVLELSRNPPNPQLSLAFLFFWRTNILPSVSGSVLPLGEGACVCSSTNTIEHSQGQLFGCWFFLSFSQLCNQRNYSHNKGQWYSCNIWILDDTQKVCGSGLLHHPAESQDLDKWTTAADNGVFPTGSSN